MFWQILCRIGDPKLLLSSTKLSPSLQILRYDFDLTLQSNITLLGIETTSNCDQISFTETLC